MYDKIKCEICGRQLGTLTPQHLKTHGVKSRNEYKNKFPGSPLDSQKILDGRKQNCKDLIGRTKPKICSKCCIEFQTSITNGWDTICEECKKPNIYQDQVYLKETDKVICQICFQAFDYITKTHLDLHGISHEDYRIKFPDAIITNKKIIDDRRIRILENNPAKVKEVQIKMSEAQRYKAEDWKNKYPWLFSIEEIRDGENGVEVKCKLCNQWFHPTQTQILERKRAFYYDSSSSFAENHFYCSKECKDLCPIYRSHPAQILSSMSNKKLYTDAEYNDFRKEVLRRQKILYGTNFCEICEEPKNLHVHHEKPKKTHPIMVLDPDNGIILCKDCHNTYGHKGECSQSALSHKIC